MTAVVPSLPVALDQLVDYVEQSPHQPVAELFQPYRDYEARLRELYAQEPHHAALKDPHANVLPLFTEKSSGVKIRARHLSSETEAEKSKYIMALPDEVRRPNGSPATVQSLKEFKRNFNIFSESSLADMDWSNVVAAGSSVVNCLLPVPKEYDVSKRTLREFYHEKFAPASDVDLFLYGLTEEEAIEKIKDIETRVRDALLTETTTVRTKHAVTICSQHPVRHIQIVLRIYKSVSEILTGFDIDCSGAAYDGRQVYVTPRALQSYMTQINHVDLTRRSPSYENRLSKYSHRGFEVYWRDLERDRIDPTIFERSFNRVLGLARLLVLERLPKPSDRDSYLDKRRAERGRPPANRNIRNQHRLLGNIKDEHDDEVAEWVQEDGVSNYHTFTLPYGPKFHAKRIEKLCYTRDLLLNAEWNQDEKREVYLHRHPAFFGRFEDVMNDCCGYCPVPVTEEEKEVAEKESKIYISGKISFMKDDPGRQEIGSFNPLTDDDWTEMAYVGNTARLCQAIVDCDAERVKGWLAQENADPNVRDYTGRTPLHLAVMSSSPEIVQLLVDAGARLVARIADGRTALHLAAERGDVQFVKILMDKSVEHEAEEEEKQEQKRKAKAVGTAGRDEPPVIEDKGSSAEESDGELVDADDSIVEGQSVVTGSFVKLDQSDKPSPSEDMIPDDDEDDPDFYDVNVVSWDTPTSALHLAIVSGHEEVVKLLCQEYGADVLIPVKNMDVGGSVISVLLTLVLALALPIGKASSMAKILLSLGATSAQADNDGVTAFHSYVKSKAEALVQVLWENDMTGSKAAINHIAFTHETKSETPLQSAARNGDLALVLKLLANGALAEIDFETWLKSAKQQIEGQLQGFDENMVQFRSTTEQPLICALRSPNPSVALRLIDRGVDLNILTVATYGQLHQLAKGWYVSGSGMSALDLVRSQLKRLRAHKLGPDLRRPKLPKGMDEYLAKFKEGSYQHWVVAKAIEGEHRAFATSLKADEEKQAEFDSTLGIREKEEAIRELIRTFEQLEKVLVEKGAKPFEELYPEEHKKYSDNNRRQADEAEDKEEKEVTFEYTFKFNNVTDVTTARKAAYLDLFEAAWNGDLNRIKQLTLASWDAQGEESPLKMAVHDDAHNNPFSLAFQRGHYDVAAAILEIVRLQYCPDEKSKTRYRMKNEDDDDNECYDSDYDSEADHNSDDSEPAPIKKEVLEERSTIDNVGQISMKVKSKTKPLEVLDWICQAYREGHDKLHKRTLLQTVIHFNDVKGLKFLLKLGELYAARPLDPDEEPVHFFTFPEAAFQTAVIQGHTELLAEIIRRTGAGLHLDQLVKSSGVELKEKPRYYQGLTVYGKKRQDWADAGRGVGGKHIGGSNTSPLLFAAMNGCIESVEWFLSDAPLRLYLEFGSSKAAAKDSRLLHLSQAPGGFEAAVSNWLNNRDELVIHAAILARPCTKSNALAAYLIKARPDTINCPNDQGLTPLLLAATFGRTEIARMLLEAGADTSVRNSSRENLLHLTLSECPTAEQLGEFLALLDAAVIRRLAHERDTNPDGGKTPLHRWLINKSTEETSAMLSLLLEKSGGAELDFLDGSGDTILHSLVLQPNHDPDVVRAIINARPSLLHRENAVGRTPVEVARDRFVADKIRPNMTDFRYYASRSYNYQQQRYWYYGNNNDEPYITEILKREPKEFVKTVDSSSATEDATRSQVEQMWDLVREIAASRPGKRRLVSLHEANDVARRLGDQHNREQRYKFRVKEVQGSDDKEKDKAKAPGNESDPVTARLRPGVAKNAWKDFGEKTEDGDDDDDGREAKSDRKLLGSF